MARPSAGRRDPAEGRAGMGNPVPCVRQAAVSDPRTPRPRVGAVREPRPSCGTPWPTSSAASGSRTRRWLSMHPPRPQPSTSSPQSGSQSTSASWSERTPDRLPVATHALPAPILSLDAARRDRDCRRRPLQGSRDRPREDRPDLDQQDANHAFDDPRDGRGGELIARNPACGKRRRVRERKPERTFLDTASTSAPCWSLPASSMPRPRSIRRPRSGSSRGGRTLQPSRWRPRIVELCALRWRYVDLAAGRSGSARPRPTPACGASAYSAALRDELAASAPMPSTSDRRAVCSPPRREASPRSRIPKPVACEGRSSGPMRTSRRLRAAAARGPDADLACAAPSKRPLRDRRVAGRGHGADGPHPPRPRPPPLCPRNAPRRR